MLTQKTSGPSVLQTGRVLFLPLGAIRPNPAQPRSVFDAAGLQELAASIRQYGVLQPLSVRKKGSGFELVAGERRLRAAGLAGLREVPCLLVSADDQDAGLLALVENLQRRDLDYIEQAQGLERLMQQFDLTPADILVVDDLKPGFDMARAAGCDFIAALWGYPNGALRQMIAEGAQGGRMLETPAELYQALFGEEMKER